MVVLGGGQFLMSEVPHHRAALSSAASVERAELEVESSSSLLSLQVLEGP